MNPNNEPCDGHKLHLIPTDSYNWDKLSGLVRPEVTPLYCGCTEGCRNFMIQQYKSLIKFAKLGIKYYKYQIIPQTIENGDHLSICEFMVYNYDGDRPEDKFIESHLNHVMRHSKFIPKEDDEDEEDKEEDEEKKKKEEEYAEWAAPWR